MGNTWQ